MNDLLQNIIAVFFGIIISFMLIWFANDDENKL